MRGAARFTFGAFSALVGLAACSGANPTPAWLAPPEVPKSVSSGTPLERFFPLVEGTLFHYVTENEMGEHGLLIARAARSSDHAGELRFPAGSKRFEYVADGVVMIVAGAPIYLLKEPLDVGTSWPGEHGGVTRVLSAKASVDVPAGHYDGCVQTLEERGGDSPVKYATTYCPSVGVVLLEAAGGASLERAELKSAGLPVEMRSDGLDQTKVVAPPP